MSEKEKKNSGRKKIILAVIAILAVTGMIIVSVIFVSKLSVVSSVSPVILQKGDSGAYLSTEDTKPQNIIFAGFPESASFSGDEGFELSNKNDSVYYIGYELYADNSSTPFYKTDYIAPGGDPILVAPARHLTKGTHSVTVHADAYTKNDDGTFTRHMVPAEQTIEFTIN